MSSAWGRSWGSSWGNSWGYIDAVQVGVVENRLVPISFSTAGLHEVVAGVNGVGVQVISYMLVAAGPVTVTFRGGTTTLTGAMTMAAGRPLKARARRALARDEGLPRDACLVHGDFGQALNLFLGGSVQVSGYMLVQRLSK